MVRGSEFQRTRPEYSMLDLKRSVLGTGILSFQIIVIGKAAVREGGTFSVCFCCLCGLCVCVVCFSFFFHQNSLVIVKSFFEGKNG